MIFLDSVHHAPCTNRYSLSFVAVSVCSNYTSGFSHGMVFYRLTSGLTAIYSNIIHATLAVATFVYVQPNRLNNSPCHITLSRLKSHTWADVQKRWISRVSPQISNIRSCFLSKQIWSSFVLWQPAVFQLPQTVLSLVAWFTTFTVVRLVLRCEIYLTHILFTLIFSQDRWYNKMAHVLLCPYGRFKCVRTTKRFYFMVLRLCYRIMSIAISIAVSHFPASYNDIDSDIIEPDSIQPSQTVCCLRV